jgi:DNA-binding transcriptional ArsR family regulator
MDIWSNSSHVILSLLLSSTTHKFWFSEIVDCTRLARATVSSNLQRLEGAGIVIREEERFKSESTFRGARVYYTLDPLAIGYLRLQELST